jgi:cardiolipin synthase
MEVFGALPRWVLEVGFIVYVIAVSAVVVLERRRPTATLALLLTLVFLPFVGIAAYLLLSRRRVQRRLRARERRPTNPLEGTRNLANVDALPDDIPPLQRGLVRLALETSAAPLRRADSAELLTTAKRAFDAVKDAIRGAKRSVHLEFYIWRDDASARELTKLLTERAREGVRVRVLYDHVGSFGLSNAHFADLVAAGGEVAMFGRLWVLPLVRRSRVNFRNHRKIITVDGEIGFVGGLNVGDEYFGERAEVMRWRDLLVELRGDAVIGLEATFLDDWLGTTGQVVDLGGAPPAAHGNPFTPLPERPAASLGPLVQVIPSGPDIPVVETIAAQFSAAIAVAQERAWIATPYFIPDEPLMLILRTAALRGVDVRVLVPRPARNDNWLVAYASRSYYDDLLEVGCRVYEYDGMLHAKYLICDEVAAIGSANMDVRSFYINYEITAMFYDAVVAAELAMVFSHDLDRAHEIRATERIALTLPARMLENVARVVSPLL